MFQIFMTYSLDWVPVKVYYHPYKVQTCDHRIKYPGHFDSFVLLSDSVASVLAFFPIIYPTIVLKCLVTKLAIPLSFPCGFSCILPFVRSNFCSYICLFSPVLVPERAFTSKTFSLSSKIWFTCTSFFYQNNTWYIYSSQDVSKNSYSSTPYQELFKDRNYVFSASCS